MLRKAAGGARGAGTAGGRVVSGAAAEHRCERADTCDVERAARENRMRVRCAAGARRVQRA
jgi:hypothetical protein